MKKIIVLLVVLALTLGAITSCDLINNLPFFGNDVEETNIEEAVKQLDDMYEDANGSATSNDFVLVAQIVLDGTTFTINWASDNDSIKLELVDGFWAVDVPEDASEQFDYKLIATITTAGGQSAVVEYNRVIAGSVGMITKPEIGKAYKFALLHGNEGPAVVYFDGNNYNNYAWYLAYTTDILSAVDVYLEAVEGVEGGYRLYYDKDGAKTYIVAFPRDGDTTKGTLKLDTVTPEEYYTWDSEYNTLVYTSVTGESFYIGSSGTYKSISLSAYSYISGATSYVAHLFGEGGVEIELPKQELPKVPENYTSKDVVEALYKLESGQTLEGPYELTGVITSIKYAYDPGYNNISVNIVVDGMTDKPVLCYRLIGGEELKVGDTITVFAGVTNYNGTYETVSGGVIREVVPGAGSDEPVTPPAGGEDNNESAVLDLMGNANLVTGSAQQNVFAANGITFTNDKASSTSDLTIQSSYAQRAYAGSTVKIEYAGMTKIVITFDDYSPDGTKTYMSGFDGMSVEGATFSRENDVLTITFAAATDVFQSTALTSQVRIEKIEVYTGEVETPVDPGTGTEPKPEEPAYTAPVAGQSYNLYMVLPTGTVYFNGALDASKGTYLDTTADAAASVKIYFEEVTGGYNIFFMNGDVKTYINAEAYLKSNGYAGCHFVLGETSTCVWTYNTELGILEVYGEISGKSDTFFAGTYGSYTTVSLSGAYYKDQIASGTQFPARIELVEGGEITPPAGGETPVDPQPPVHEHNFVEGKCECGETDPNYVPETPVEPDDGTMSIPDVLASASGTSVVVKGTVCEIYQSWNDQYSNISFYIKDEAGNKLLAYRCKGTKVVVGDVVTITGTTTLYNNTIQIAQDCTAVIDVKHVCSTFTEGSCTADSYCTVCGELHATATGHNYVDGTCANCGNAEPTGDFLPGNLAFSGAANKASADDYMKTNFPEWKITGKLGQTYGGYLGFGRSGDAKSAITSSAFSVSSEFTITTVLKGNGSSGVATSTLTFTLIDADGNTIATGYADGSSTAAITPVDAKDTTYNISFTFVEGKTWTDVSNLVITFAKSTGNIGLKSLDFVK